MMKLSKQVFLSPFLLSLLVLVSSKDATLKPCHFEGIYQLGDSISDTGNLVQENPASVFGRLPYGQNFPEKANGRCSNGFLMIDYIAQSSGIPLLDAYHNPNGTFYRGHGANFAVAGATALSVEDLAAKGIINSITNSSLGLQLDWMYSFFDGICYNPDDCIQKLKSALFMVGEIGFEDYKYALFQGKSINEVKLLVPEIVQAIKQAVTRVISYGAVRVVVPGNFPIGCLPIYLTRFEAKNRAAYDEFHCLEDLNNLAMDHNVQLQQAIEELRKENPKIIIVYGDYYNALTWILKQAQLLGFEDTSMQKACCGTGGTYNYNGTRQCGAPGVPVCSNPDNHISWDGIGFTQKTYQYAAQWLVNDIFPKLRCSTN